MVVYRFRCAACYSEFEGLEAQAKCSCGAVLKWSGMAQRPDDGVDLRDRLQTGYKMGVESPARYNAWFNSDDTQSKLRSGDLVIPTKSDDVRHM